MRFWGQAGIGLSWAWSALGALCCYASGCDLNPVGEDPGFTGTTSDTNDDVFGSSEGDMKNAADDGEHGVGAFPGMDAIEDNPSSNAAGTPADGADGFGGTNGSGDLGSTDTAGNRTAEEVDGSGGIPSEADDTAPSTGETNDPSFDAGDAGPPIVQPTTDAGPVVPIDAEAPERPTLFRRPH